MDASRHDGHAATAPRATASMDAMSPGSAYRARTGYMGGIPRDSALGVRRSSRPQSVEVRQASLCVGAADSSWPMPPLARKSLERALCRVLERRHPGVRFAMKDELDAAGQRAASSGDTDGLKDRL
jgi:hypothetical protein